MVMKSYYDILGIPVDATEEEVKKAFRALALKWHPDQSDHPNAREYFQEIREAYETLIDPKKRSVYDYRHGFVGRNSSGRGRGKKFSSSNADLSGWDKRHVANLLHEYFGISWRGGNSSRCNDLRFDFHFLAEQLTVVRKETIHYTRLVYCQECVGKGLSYKNCSICRGRGFTEEEAEVNVTIPAGCPSGYQLRIHGGGDHTYPQARPGDLIIYVHVVNRVGSHR